MGKTRAAAAFNSRMSRVSIDARGARDTGAQPGSRARGIWRGTADPSLSREALERIIRDRLADTRPPILRVEIGTGRVLEDRTGLYLGRGLGA